MRPLKTLAAEIVVKPPSVCQTIGLIMVIFMLVLDSRSSDDLTQKLVMIWQCTALSESTFLTRLSRRLGRLCRIHLLTSCEAHVSGLP